MGLGERIQRNVILVLLCLPLQLPLLSHPLPHDLSTVSPLWHFSDSANTRILWHRTKVDLGYVPLETERTETIRFTNAGDDPLRISEVKLACECITQVTYPRGALAPGEEGELIISIQVQNEGPFSCYLTILSNSLSYADVLNAVGIGY